ncbi:hypothetical protein PMAYCL1PPCAC_01377, partial [Pristionchus mayeri]
LRDTGSYVALLIIEALVGLLVVLSNMIVMIILAFGWKRLMKNHFYIVVSNLIVFTSLKGVVEMCFVVPYYVMQNKKILNSMLQPFGIFSKSYEFFFFNISVLADYGNLSLTVFSPISITGVLFFSVVIAVNRYLAITRSTDARPYPKHRLRTSLSCMAAWVISAIIPLLFIVCQCQYTYRDELKLYYNECAEKILWIQVLLNILIYLTYVCAVLVIILYLLIFVYLRREKRKLPNTAVRTSNRTPVEMKLLRQSLIIFILYTLSMFSVLMLSFIDPGQEGMFSLAYAENLLNLSIAAIYPICFVAMSGDMKSILISKLTPSVSGRVA